MENNKRELDAIELALKEERQLISLFYNYAESIGITQPATNSTARRLISEVQKIMNDVSELAVHPNSCPKSIWMLQGWRSDNGRLAGLFLIRNINGQSLAFGGSAFESIDQLFVTKTSTLVAAVEDDNREKVYLDTLISDSIFKQQINQLANRKDQTRCFLFHQLVLGLVKIRNFRRFRTKQNISLRVLEQQNIAEVRLDDIPFWIRFQLVSGKVEVAEVANPN